MNQMNVLIPGEVIQAKFVNRPNRFLVNLVPEGKDKTEPAFLHDPGRMKELLYPNAKLLIRKPINENKRKTKWDILGVYHKNRIVVINSSFPNKIIKEALKQDWIEDFKEYKIKKPEISIGNSRLDFLLESKKQLCYIEVKGVTLVEGERALFPDAPTTRGTRHLRELIKLKEEGNRAVIIFVCMRSDPKIFSPNWETDPEFSKQLLKAKKAGIENLVFVIEPKIIKNQLVLTFQGKIKTEIVEAIKSKN